MAEGVASDELDIDQYLEDGDAVENESGQQRKRKKRVRNWTAEDRARHRIFERSRREAFNERLNELASLIPALKNAKDTQLSKHVIVDESVKQHHAQQATILEMTRSLDELQVRHQQLLSEVNAWRQTVSLPQWQAVSSSTNGEAGAVVTTAQHNVSMPPFVSAPEHAAAQVSHDSTAEMHRFAARPPGAVLPDLGTYPGSLVQLEPDPTNEGGLRHSDHFKGSKLGADGFQIPQPSTFVTQNGTLASHAVFHDHRLQRLFARFQDPNANSAVCHGPVGAEAVTCPPTNIHDAYASQWHQNNSEKWIPSGGPQDYAETVVNAGMYFRNNSTITNI